jgi:hypothetical protein
MNIKKINEELENLLQEYMIIDYDSAECEIGFSSKENAMRYIEKMFDNYTILSNKEDIDKLDGEYALIIAPCEEVSEDAEMIIYKNPNVSPLSEVAEYKEDLLNTDILDSLDTPIKYCYA